MHIRMYGIMESPKQGYQEAMYRINGDYDEAIIENSNQLVVDVDANMPLEAGAELWDKIAEFVTKYSNQATWMRLENGEGADEAFWGPDAKLAECLHYRKYFLETLQELETIEEIREALRF